VFKDKKVSEFLDQLASDSPTPGGGTVAALSASLAASLVSMVASLSVGKKRYMEYDTLYNEVIEKMKDYSGKFQTMMDGDAAAFDGVMNAFGLPKNTPEEKAERTEAIQKSLKTATESPFHTAENVVIVAQYAREMVKFGNKKAVSDASCALELCRAAFNMAMENVDINIDSIKDETFCEEMKGKCVELKQKLDVYLQA